MDTTFHGAAVITLDAKGRVAVPTRHRAPLLQGEKKLVLTAHPDGCVLEDRLEQRVVRRRAQHGGRLHRRYAVAGWPPAARITLARRLWPRS